MSTTTSFKTPPPELLSTKILFPTSQILLIVLDNPKSLNSLSTPVHWSLDRLLAWYDNEPGLRCAIMTGAGRAFCAGADLKEWNESNARTAAKTTGGESTLPASGFGAVSRRSGKKPLIGAINGLAFGAGLEMVANMDLVVAAKSAQFCLPEVKRGTVAIAGALPRIARTLGRPRAMELALTGRPVAAREMKEWGFVNAVTDDAPADAHVLSRPVVQKALEYAEQIASNSPDSVIVSRAGIILGWEDGSAEHASTNIVEVWGRRLNEGENLHEGVRAFVEKRQPTWVGSKL
ncbi:hypothetical protein LTR84_000538 [Exophiala bonariae]|uniref:Enoyl-CoA hydratase n=1 Tax=Exophiala bonariae TaxID=1690606 RepID=A0AAV9NQW5_9EURO|nr:hypothetical protein LTR84_000538 [Exophiala bonariae]